MMARTRMRLIQFDLLPISFDKVLTIKLAKFLLASEAASPTFKLEMSHLINVWEQIEVELIYPNF